jgi:hypothetical protein
VNGYVEAEARTAAAGRLGAYRPREPIARERPFEADAKARYTRWFGRPRLPT